MSWQDLTVASRQLTYTAGGKDRSGVAVMLILGLAGVPPEVISREYALTRIGVEPARRLLTEKLTGGKVVDMRSDHMQMISQVT